MTLKNIFFGKSEGKTAWQLIRDKIFGANILPINPFALQLGDLVDLHKSTTRNFRCENIIRYRSEDNKEVWVRFGLKDLLSGEVFLLEIMPDGSGDYFYILFKLIDEIEYDTNLVNTIKEENVLRFTHDNNIIDYEKDFIIICSLEITRKNKYIEIKNILSANYVYRNNTNNTEEYLSIDIVSEHNRISFYHGEKLLLSDIIAYGTNPR